MKKINTNNFIHGWLLLDPLKGLIDKNADCPIYKNFIEVCTWLLNLALKYHYTNLEESINFLDYRMHHHLQPNSKPSWEKSFEAESDDYWDSFKQETERPLYKDLPHWFSFVTKWFLQGLNGPIGVVNTFPDKFLDSLYNSNVDLAEGA